MLQLLKVNKIEPQTVDVFFDDNGTPLFIGNVNEYELLDLRLQIKNKSLHGYYIYFNDEKIFINSYGKISKWPVGLFDTIQNYLFELL